MITQNSVTVACRCPYCGAVIQGEITMSALTSGQQNIKCKECQKSFISVSLSNDAKVRLTVPCITCPHPHPFTLSEEIFFGKVLFPLSCSYSGLDICFIGTRELVEKALRESEVELSALSGETSAADENPSMFPIFNHDVTQEILYVVEDLHLSKGIHCTCENPDDQNLSVTIGYDSVNLKCNTCNASCSIDSKSRFDLSKILDVDEIELK